MIMVTRTISFNDPLKFAAFKSNETFPVSLRSAFDSLLEELRRLKVLGFSEIDDKTLTFTQVFVWESQTNIDLYLKWAEDNHNYTAFYAEWSEYVNSLNGTITVSQSEM